MPPPKGRSTFQDDWLVKPEYKNWLEKKSDSTIAFCKICKSSISLSSMGNQALVSHMKGKNHNKKLSNVQKTLAMDQFVTLKSTPKTLPKPTTTNQCSNEAVPRKIKNLIFKINL